MKKVLFSLVLFVFCLFHSGNAQNKKNAIEFILSPNISKTNFQDIRKISSNRYKRLYDTSPPNQFFFGFGIGVNYSRKITRNLGLKTGFSYVIHGQKSNFFYSINGIPDSQLDNKPNYGGTSYAIISKSVEIPISLNYTFIRNKKLNHSIAIGSMLNIYYRTGFQDYIYDRNGKKQHVKCCAQTYYHWTGGFYKEIIKHIDSGLIRIGLTTGYEIEYKIDDDFSFFFNPELNIYSSLLTKLEYNTIVKGSIFSFDLNIGSRLTFQKDKSL